MLELKIKAGYGQNNINKNINYLELIKALEELGIHTEKSGSLFYFILNFKAINCINYVIDGFGYMTPEYTLVESNCISLTYADEAPFPEIFGINLDHIYTNNGIVCKIIGYWTDNDEY